MTFVFYPDMLYLYGVLSDNNTHNVKRLLDQFEFEDGVDYIVNVNVDGKAEHRPQNNFF